MPLDDPRLRQQGTRLEVPATDLAGAKAVSDELMMRRARLRSFPRPRPGTESDGGGDSSGGIYVDGGGYDGGGDGGSCDGG
jgi:hypothetical protein